MKSTLLAGTCVATVSILPNITAAQTCINYGLIEPDWSNYHHVTDEVISIDPIVIDTPKSYELSKAEHEILEETFLRSFQLIDEGQFVI